MNTAVSHSKRSDTQRRAFTLLELLAVVLVISLVATLVTITAGSRIGAERLERDLERIHTTLLEARAQALRTQRATLVTFASALIDDGEGRSASVWSTFRSEELESPLRVVSRDGVVASGAWVVFSPLGEAFVGVFSQPIPSELLSDLPLETVRVDAHQHEFSAPHLHGLLAGLPNADTTLRWRLIGKDVDQARLPRVFLSEPFTQPLEPVGIFEELVRVDETAEEAYRTRRARQLAGDDARPLPLRGITQRVASRAQERDQLAAIAAERSQREQPSSQGNSQIETRIEQPPSGLDKGIIMLETYAARFADRGSLFGVGGRRVDLSRPAEEQLRSIGGSIHTFTFDPLSGMPVREQQFSN